MMTNKIWGLRDRDLLILFEEDNHSHIKLEECASTLLLFIKT